MNIIKQDKLILASKSPRRRYLLKQAGLSFSVIPSNIDEKALSRSDPESYVKTLAELKSKDISKRFPESWVIGADTIVMIDNMILGKPDTKARARNMLTQLSGKSHYVFTGFCICCESKSKIHADIVKTEVVFKDLSDEEIKWYINTDEPFDKAGAYAIQHPVFSPVTNLQDCYASVMGLPFCHLLRTLQKMELPSGMDPRHICLNKLGYDCPVSQQILARDV